MKKMVTHFSFRFIYYSSERKFCTNRSNAGFRLNARIPTGRMSQLRLHTKPIVSRKFGGHRYTWGNCRGPGLLRFGVGV